MATSLDGFVAREDHKLDWLMKQDTQGEDHGYDAFIESVDGIIMGSGSFRTVIGFEEWPYTIPVVVMSQTLTSRDVPARLQGKVKLSALEPQELLARLESEGWERAYIDGGKIVQTFLRLGLIEDLVLTTAPILIGKGKRLFGPGDRDIDLGLVSSKSFASGLVQSHYRVKRS